MIMVMQPTTTPKTWISQWIQPLLNACVEQEIVKDGFGQELNVDSLTLAKM